MKWWAKLHRWLTGMAYGTDIRDLVDGMDEINGPESEKTEPAGSETANHRRRKETGGSPVKKIRKRMVFHGEVQGVGFRYTAKQVADYFGLTGYVKNEYDGSVTAEVQGTAEDIRSFAPSIEKSSRWIVIDRVDEREIPVKEDERSFHVIGY